MKFFKFLAVLAMFLFSVFPTTVASIYAFGGGKQGLIDFIAEIPIGRFWLLGVPLFIICLAASTGLMYLTFHIGLSPDEPAKPLSIDDPDLVKKIRRLNMLETQTH